MIKIETNLEIVAIPDLKLFVRKHDPIWITQEQYNSSLALKRLEKMGSVVCYPNQRSREMAKLPKAPKSAPIRTNRFSRPNKNGPPNKPDNSNLQMQEEVKRATSEVARQAAEQAVQNVAEQILARLPAQQQTPAATNVEGLEDMIQKAVLNALGNVQVVSGSATLNEVQQGPEEPIYIPSNIVDKDVKGNVNIKSETSESEGLDDAAEALKELRKSKPKRRK